MVQEEVTVEGGRGRRRGQGPYVVFRSAKARPFAERKATMEMECTTPWSGRDTAKQEGRGLVMSTIVGAATPIAAGGRMTVDEFEQIDESLDGPFELIDGKLTRKPDLDPPHVWSTERLRKWLRAHAPPGLDGTG